MEMNFSENVSGGIPSVLPDPKPIDDSVPHAPVRPQILSVSEKKACLVECFEIFSQGLACRVSPRVPD